MLRQTGNLFALGLDIVRGLFQRPFQFREFIQQSWFIASVTILPTALVAIPFGAVISLQFGSLARQLGAQSYTGAGSVLATVQQASPLVTALLVAGAGGSAVCADIGARTIREEIAAMEVLGVSAVQRLIVPRTLAMMLVALLLNGMVSVIGVLGGYFFNVVLQGGTPGAYLASFSALAQLPDLWVGELKALIFGFIAAVLAAYRGLHPAGGSKVIGGTVGVMVGLTLFTGVLVGLQGYSALNSIGTSAFTGFLTAFFNTREIAPLVAGLALSATVGAGFTAQLGAMRISEEIDALEGMGVRSVPYLVTTRITAGVVAVIPLYAVGLVSSYVASRAVTVFSNGQSSGTN